MMLFRGQLCALLGFQDELHLLHGFLELGLGKLVGGYNPYKNMLVKQPALLKFGGKSNA